MLYALRLNVMRASSDSRHVLVHKSNKLKPAAILAEANCIRRCSSTLQAARTFDLLGNLSLTPHLAWVICTFFHPLTYIQSNHSVHASEKCVPLQCIILEVILGVIEVKVLGINPDCDLKGKPKQPLEVFHLLLVLLRLLEIGILAVKDLHKSRLSGLSGLKSWTSKILHKWAVPMYLSLPF